MLALAARKHVELGEKLASLQRDFAAWRALAETANDPLRLHRSQIAILTRTLGALATDFQNALPAQPPPDAAGAGVFLDEARNTENMFLATHSVWAFFRKKLAQRLEPGFDNFLDAADELAWACYEPAFKAAGHAPKEPPLVFLNGALSPFMVAREKAYVPEDVPPDFLGLAEFQGLVSRLPVPVIGVPWAQAGYLPDTLAVAHEAGHVIEHDFSLEKELDDAIGAVVPDARKKTWLGWRSEIFADLWACAALGPAYVSALCDVLAADPQRHAAEQGQHPDYPTPHLRIMLNLAALELAGFTGKKAEPVEKLRALWSSAVPVAPASAFAKDAPAVAAAVLQARPAVFKKKPVEKIFGPFGPGDFAEAKNVFTELQRGSANLGTGNVRIVFAAARQGYDADPASWGQAQIADRLLARFDRTKLPAETLLGLGTRAAKARSAPQADAALASDLLAQLRRLAAPKQAG